MPKSHQSEKPSAHKEHEIEEPEVSKEPEPASMPLPPQPDQPVIPVVQVDPEPTPPQPPLNFACLYYCSFSSEPWPDVVAEWGRKSVHNQYFLDHLKQVSAHNEYAVRLIEALQRDLEIKD